MHHVVLTKTAKKDLRRIDRRYIRRVLATLESLQEDPERGKQLAGKLKQYRSVRVWPYRILYKLEKKRLVVYVIRIARRQGAY